MVFLYISSVLLTNQSLKFCDIGELKGIWKHKLWGTNFVADSASYKFEDTGIVTLIINVYW